MKTSMMLMGVLMATGSAMGQSLNERPTPPVALTRTNDTASSSAAATGPSMPASTEGALRGVSLFMVSPPPPKTYQKNDIVEIIINESSNQKSEQSLDTKKDYSTSAELTRFPSLRHLLEAQLRDGDTTPIVGVDAKSNNKFKGDGEYERKDKFTARIAAVVIEVKPNGTLLLEAKKEVTTNKEETTLVLSGLCRPDDITAMNTIQSSQLANMALTVKNSGDLKSASTKGLIPQVLDTIFNF